MQIASTCVPITCYFWLLCLRNVHDFQHLISWLCLMWFKITPVLNLLLIDLWCNPSRNAVSHWRVMALNSHSKSTHLKRLVLWQTNSRQTISLLLLRWACCILVLCIYLRRCTTFATNSYWCDLIFLVLKEDHWLCWTLLLRACHLQTLMP